jgi:hypothetical protein
MRGYSSAGSAGATDLREESEGAPKGEARRSSAPSET